MNRGSTLNNLDVTEQIIIDDVGSVAEEVFRLLNVRCPNDAFNALAGAFNDFERLYNGLYPGFRACDTPYHDLQHILDVTLTLARILIGHETTAEPDALFGCRRIELGLIIALFHDSGYIIKIGDPTRNGAEYTRTHVTRSGQFLSHYLPTVGFADSCEMAAEIVHNTGYERSLDTIWVDDATDRRLGHAVGSADLLAQMADRCYLEKCRDRLYPEFVAGGVDRLRQPDGQTKIIYHSGLDLVKKTPSFLRSQFSQRMDSHFAGIHRQLRALYAGKNPYRTAIDNHLKHAEWMLQHDDFSLLRRRPPPTPVADEFPDLAIYLGSRPATD